MFVVVFVLYDDGVSSKRNFSSLPLNPWRGRKKSNGKQNLLFNILNNFQSLKDIGVSKGYTHKMYSKVFAIPSKYFIWKVLTTLGFIWWKSTKKSWKQVNVIWICYILFILLMYIFTLLFLVFFWFLFLGNNFRKFIDFCSYFFHMPCFNFITFFLLYYLFEWFWNCKTKTQQELRMCWILLENVSIFLTESKLNCWIELRYKIDYQCFVLNVKDQSILCYANIMFWLWRISEKI